MATDNSQIKAVIDKIIEHAIAETSITKIVEEIGIPLNAKLYGEIGFNAGGIKRTTTNRVRYQDVLMTILVNGDNLGDVRVALETLRDMYYVDSNLLVELKTVKVHDIETINLEYPTKHHAANKPWGSVTYEYTLRITP